ncbi:MAG: S41 family peptidase [Alphaproteobacteria bacterium]
MKAIQDMRLRVAFSGVAVSLLLAACAGGFGGDGFNRASAERMIGAGYSQITTRYLEPVTLEAIATAGLSGLHDIDPDLRLAESAGGYTVYYKGSEISFRAKPSARAGAEKWAEMTIAILQDGRKSSDILARVDAETLYDAILQNAVSILDPFSRYDSPARAREERAQREGFDGIGIAVVVGEDSVRVGLVYAETPAAAAGLVPGDMILAADERPLAGLSPTTVVNLLRGPPRSIVTLKVLRDGVAEPFDVAVERSHIVLPTVEARRTNDVLHIHLTGFNQETARRLAGVLGGIDHSDTALKGLVLDLRGNPGGLLDQAIEVADLFMSSGVILTTDGRHPDADQNFAAGGQDLARGLPLVVLINGNSASAAEVVAAALQDRGRGLIVGTNSFGKGSIQSITRLPNDGELTLTWARFVAPSGYAIHGLGLLPDICTAGNEGPASAQIAAATRAMESHVIQATQWRIQPVATAERRAVLRSYCTADPSLRDSDMAVALGLLNDRGLYNRLLAASHQAASR